MTTQETSEKHAFDAFVAERLGGDLNGLTLEEAVSEFRAYEAELRTIQSKLDKAEEQYARGEAKPIDKDAFLADVNRRLDERGIPN